MFVVAQISDLHFNGTANHRRRNEAVVAYLNRHADGIDALVVTGDLADTGTADQYREFVEVVKTPLPTLVTIGNHDNLATFRAVTQIPENSILDVGGVRIIAVDSSLPDSASGYLSEETLGFIDSAIRDVGGSTPVFLAFHHPPVVLHMPVMDVIRQTGEERLAALVSSHPNIVALLCGHAHTPAVTTFAGKPLCLAPGVSSTLNLPFEGDGVINVGQPPSIAFHLLDDERLTTHFRVAV